MPGFVLTDSSPTPKLPVATHHEHMLIHVSLSLAQNSVLSSHSFEVGPLQQVSNYRYDEHLLTYNEQMLSQGWT